MIQVKNIILKKTYFLKSLYQKILYIMITGTLFVISAPSGTGKSSLIKAFLKKSFVKNIEVSISHTTRLKRPKEIHGKDYYFVSISTFKKMIFENEFIEYAKVFNHYYGTSKKSIIQKLSKGIDLFLDIDWQGAEQIKTIFPRSKSIFLLPPSKKDLYMRLKKRRQDSILTIENRMRTVTAEIKKYKNYDYIIINDDFNLALRDIKYIILSQRLSVEKQKTKYCELIKQLLKK